MEGRISCYGLMRGKGPFFPIFCDVARTGFLLINGLKTALFEGVTDEKWINGRMTPCFGPLKSCFDPPRGVLCRVVTFENPDFGTFLIGKTLAEISTGSKICDCFANQKCPKFAFFESDNPAEHPKISSKHDLRGPKQGVILPLIHFLVAALSESARFSPLISKNPVRSPCGKIGKKGPFPLINP